MSRCSICNEKIEGIPLYIRWGAFECNSHFHCGAIVTAQLSLPSLTRNHNFTPIRCDFCGEAYSKEKPPKAIQKAGKTIYMHAHCAEMNACAPAITISAK